MKSLRQTIDLSNNLVKATVGVIEGSPSIQFVPEQQLRQAANQIVWLRTEIRELRRALVQVRRWKLHQELLLRRSRRRELKLRASLVEGGGNGGNSGFTSQSSQRLIGRG